MRIILRFTIFAMLTALLICLCVSVQTPAQSAPQKSSPDGLLLLHKMQKALGGAEKIAAIHDYEESVRAQAWNNAGIPMGEVRKRTRWIQKSNLLRLDQLGPRNTYVLFFDGDSQSGWEILPDMKNADRFKTTGEAIALVGGELKFAQNYISNFDFNLWLADRIPSYVVTSPAPNVLRIAHDGAANDLTLNSKTMLPTKSASISLANPDQPVSSEMRFDGWTKVAGIFFATHRINYHSGVKLAEMTDEEPLRVNAGLMPSELAAKPADFAPVIPAR